MKQTVCLNMIVRDEEPVIRRCLESVLPFITHWVIVDTGSVDATRQIVREMLRHLPGELHERPWIDFGHNRTEALQLACGHGDYVLLIDADNVLTAEPDFSLPELTACSYDVETRTPTICYTRRQLVKNGLAWRYIGVAHEYIMCDNEGPREFLPGLYSMPYRDGARARTPDTYSREAATLEKALETEPDNSRYVFYLAQSYRDAGKLEDAIRIYRRRATMGGWRDEVWYSLYQIALLLARMSVPWPDVVVAQLAAWQYLPDRAEPLFRLGLHYSGVREYANAYLFLKQAILVPPPSPANRLFVEYKTYAYALPLEFAVAAYYVGRDDEAMSTYDVLLRGGGLTAVEEEKIKANRNFSLMRVGTKALGFR